MAEAITNTALIQRLSEEVHELTELQKTLRDPEQSVSVAVNNSYIDLPPDVIDQIRSIVLNSTSEHLSRCVEELKREVNGL